MNIDNKEKTSLS